MKSAVHAREPSYGGVTGFVGHERDVSYGGVEDLEPEMFTKDAPKAGGGPSHARDLSYGGIRSMF